MKNHKGGILFISVMAFLVVLSRVDNTNAQDRPFFSPEPGKSIAHPSPALRCKGPITSVLDVGFEGLKFTPFNWSSTAGGGESGRFDPTPVLSTTVTLTDGCLDAHLSAMVGSKATYGPLFGVSSITMFQVTLTPIG